MNLIRSALLMSVSLLMSLPAVATQEMARPVGIKKAVDQVKRDLASQKQEYAKVLKSLYQINREMKRIVEERSALDQERILIEAQVKGVGEKIDKIEKRLAQQKSLLITKLSFMNKFSAEAWFKFVLNAENSAQMERNMKILGLIGQRDMQVLKDYANSKKDLRRQQAIYTNRMAHVVGLQQKISATEISMKEQTEARNTLLAGIKEKQQSTLDRLRRLQSGEDENKLIGEAGILDALLKDSFAERKGDLPSPVLGSLTQNYGVIRDNEYHLILSHRGWMYSAPAQSPVRSVFVGTLAHIGYFPEYGKYVIIDHGDHFYTVYGMLNEVNAKVGDTVKEGQAFAHTGHNPFDGKPGLYFEIRHFAETLDPKPWIKDRTKGTIYEISKIEL